MMQEEHEQETLDIYNTLTLHDGFDMWGWNIEIERYLFLASF